MSFTFNARHFPRLAVSIVLLSALIVVGRSKLGAISYNQGNDLLSSDQYLQAKSAFQRALRMNSGRPALIHYGLAQASAGLQQQAEAAAEYRRAIAFDPALTQAYIGLAELLRSQQEYEEALTVFEQAPPAVRADSRLTTQEGYIRQELGYSTLEKAIDAFDRKDLATAQSLMAEALAWVPDGPQMHYTAGFFAFVRSDYAQALASLRQALALDRQHFPALKLMAAVYFDQGQFELAIEYYKTALSLLPDDSETLSGIGLSYMNLERYDQALEYLLRAAGLRPADAHAVYSVAGVYRDKGDTKNARLWFAKALGLAPKYVNIHNDLADIWLLEGDTAAAATEFRSERDARLADLERMPAGTGEVLNSLAYAYAGLGQFPEAEAAALKVLALSPQSRQAYLTLAKVYQQTGRPAQAITALEKAKTFSRAKDFIDTQVAAVRRHLLKDEKTFSEKMRP